MSPETAQAISAVATIIDKLGTLPLGTLLIIVLFGPWMFSFIMSRLQEKRFEAVKEMYESNVKLVEEYRELATTLNDIVTLNTAKWSETLEKIDTNQFCPMTRVKKQRMEDVSG
jgi:Asp-tRNA(Asn)/Glu-tRNA(Gln) amidotransferase C subunit